MALTITPKITGQLADSNLSYCYLYEPLRIEVYESNLVARKMYVDILTYSIVDSSLVGTFVKYAEFDINPGIPLTFDLMEITGQLHDSNIYKIGNVSDLISATSTIISKYFYEYRIYTEQTPYLVVKKLPIIGGRDFGQFEPPDDYTNPTSEIQLYVVDGSELTDKIKSPVFTTTLKDTSIVQNYTPTVTYTTPECFPRGGRIYWKSRFGGYMSWGFDLSKKMYGQSYKGSLDVGMFEEISGHSYIPVNYTEVNSTYSFELKSLSLSKIELLVVAGIYASPVVYYQENSSTTLELMRMTSASVPLSNLANGGDFTVSLQNISVTSQKTI